MLLAEARALLDECPVHAEASGASGKDEFRELLALYVDSWDEDSVQRC